MKPLIVCGLFLSAAVLAGPDLSRAENQPQKDAVTTTNHTTDSVGTKETRTLIKESADVYKAITSSAKQGVPDEVMESARCVAVFPSVVTAALVVGGTHGDGVLSCKNDGKWSPPAFVDMSGGSIGAQIGGKSSEILLFVMDEKSQKAIENGNIKLGADVSVTAGTFDKRANIGVVAYQRTEGAFAGASISGVRVASDKEAIRDYYGQSVDFATLIQGDAQVSPSRGQELTSVLPG